MHAYVINLASSLDRRAHVVSELEKTALDYEFVAAVMDVNWICMTLPQSLLHSSPL